MDLFNMDLQQRIEQMLKFSSDENSMFYYNKQNKYCIKKGFFYGIPVDELYKEFGDDFLEHLDSMNEYVSFKDKIIIKEIKLLIKKII
jgi:hypothetical protein